MGGFMFLGEYHQKIDEKGRLTIPAKIRNELGNDFIVTRGMDGCLFIYQKNIWDKIISKYQDLPNIKETRNFMRFLLSGANTQNFDRQGRININTSLIKYASLTKDCVVIGVGDRLEIWDEERWNKFTLENENSFSEMADSLFIEKLN